jgi:hypothetical protein
LLVEGDEPVEIVAASGMPKAEVADFVEARWEHVLEKTPDELIGVEVHGVPLESFAVLVAEADSAVVDGEDSVIGDGMPEDVAGEVLQDTISTFDGGFDKAAPLLRIPGDGSVYREFFSSHGDELRGEDLRESSCGYEE